MSTTTNHGKRRLPKRLLHRFSYAVNEAVWQLALVTVVAAALINGALSIGAGGGTLA